MRRAITNHDAPRPLPPALHGWRWERNTENGRVCLIAPDGWATKAYRYRMKAIRAALRYVRSLPHAKCQEVRT